MKVLKISADGLFYINYSKEIVFVDFHECNENWIMHNKQKYNWTKEEEIDFRSRSKCIGQRDICANPKYFQFFTKPESKIEFTGFFANKKFNSLRNKINDLGWTTFDLS